MPLNGRSEQVILEVPNSKLQISKPTIHNPFCNSKARAVWQDIQRTTNGANCHLIRTDCTINRSQGGKMNTKTAIALISCYLLLTANSALAQTWTQTSAPSNNWGGIAVSA